MLPYGRHPADPIATQEALMHATQNLPIFFPLAPTGSLVGPGVWRAVSDRLSHIVALARRLVGAAMDDTRLSPHMLRDIGLVRGEFPHVGSWDRGRIEYRL